MKATMASISIPSSSSSSTQTSKRLLFDRRYGWVIDEWKPPSEEALTGGRGMFCILPLARALLKMASQSINLAASSAVKALEKPDLFSPHVLQAGFKGQLHKIKSSLTNSDINSLSQGCKSMTNNFIFFGKEKAEVIESTTWHTHCHSFKTLHHPQQAQTTLIFQSLSHQKMYMWL